MLMYTENPGSVLSDQAEHEQVEEMHREVLRPRETVLSKDGSRRL
jgi:hypothetical protein